MELPLKTRIRIARAILIEIEYTSSKKALDAFKKNKDRLDPGLEFLKNN